MPKSAVVMNYPRWLTLTTFDMVEVGTQWPGYRQSGLIDCQRVSKVSTLAQTTVTLPVTRGPTQPAPRPPPVRPPLALSAPWVPSPSGPKATTSQSGTSGDTHTRAYPHARSSHCPSPATALLRPKPKPLPPVLVLVVPGPTPAPVVTTPLEDRHKSQQRMLPISWSRRR
ncbi:hypothetical protein BKA93DRAFT_831752 [Sparassis latifolia]